MYVGRYLCFVELGSVILYFQSSYYTAAVVEYSAVGNISIHDPRQVLMMNADKYVDYVRQAASSVSICVCVFVCVGLAR